MTTEAFIPLVKGGLNSRIRSLLRSDTHRFPDRSKAMSSGVCRPFAVVAARDTEKFGCPMTRDAFIPFVNGGLNSRTLLFPPSAIQMSPWLSHAIKAG